MAGLLDFLSPVNPDGSVDAHKLGLLNMLQAGAKYSEPTRTPTSGLGAVLGTLAAGGQGGIQAAELTPKLGLLNQQAMQAGISNYGALDQLNRRLALGGSGPVTAGPNGVVSPAGAGPGGGLGLLSGGGGAPVGVLNGPAGRAIAGRNISNMTRQEAGDAALQYSLAGLNDQAKQYTDYAKDGVLGGYENTRTGGLGEIQGGPKTQQQQLQDAANKQLIALTPTGAVLVPGVAGAKATEAGATAGATAAAQLPSELRKIGAQSDANVSTAWRSPHEIVPGGSLVGLVTGSGVQQLYQSPVPAPGSQQGRLEAGQGDTGAKMYDDAVNQGVAAAKENAVIGKQIEQVENGLKLGWGFGGRKATADVLTSIGIDPTKFGLPDSTQAAVFTNAQREQLIAKAKSFGANPSNAEDRYILESIANSSNPTEAVRALLQWKQSRNNALQQYGEAMHAQGKADPVGFAQKYARGNPSFTAPNATGGGAPAAPAPADVTLDAVQAEMKRRGL